MNSLKKISAILLTFLLTVAASAQNVDIIQTKNGNQYEGYLIKQIPGKSVQICSAKSVISAAKEDVVIFGTSSVLLADLSDEAVEMFPYSDAENNVEKADVRVTDKNGRETTYRNSLILQRGEEIRFVTFEKMTVDISWSDIKVSRKTPYNMYADTGVYDVLLLPDATTLTGQLLEQNVKTGMITFLSDDGTLTTFRKNDVQAVRSEPVNKKMSIWEQIPYCDKIDLKDGSYIKGFIQSKVFGKSVTVLNYNSEENSEVPVTDISCYEKYPNPLYAGPDGQGHKKDKKVPELFVNGEHRDMDTFTIEKDTYILTTLADSIRTVVNAGALITIQVMSNTRTSGLRIAKISSVKEKTYFQMGSTVERKGNFPAFKSSNIISHPDLNIQSNDGEYIICDYRIPEPGTYVLVIEGSEKCVAFKAE